MATLWCNTFNNLNSSIRHSYQDRQIKLDSQPKQKSSIAKILIPLYHKIFRYSRSSNYCFINTFIGQKNKISINEPIYIFDLPKKRIQTRFFQTMLPSTASFATDIYENAWAVGIFDKFHLFITNFTKCR